MDKGVANSKATGRHGVQSRPPGVPVPPQQARAQSLVWHLKAAAAIMLLWRCFVFGAWAINLLIGSNSGNLLSAQMPSASSCSIVQHSEPSTNGTHYDASLSSDQIRGQDLAFCEDGEMLRGSADGWALFSCDNSRGRWNTVMGPLADPTHRGALWMWNYAESGADPILLQLEGYPSERDFHPLGTAFHEESNTLFVINHGRDHSTIEVFDLLQTDSGWTAHHESTIWNYLATHTPNALVALSRSTILISNDHFFAKRPPADIDALTATYREVTGSFLLGSLLATLARTRLFSVVAPKLETLFGLGGGWVAVLHLATPDEPRKMTIGRIVASGIPFANGLAVSADSRTLAVASTTGPTVRLYDLPDLVDENADIDANGVFYYDPDAKKKMTEYTTISVPFTPDNLAFSHTSPDAAAPDSGDGHPFGDKNSHLIVAGHPSVSKIFGLASDPYSGQRSAPSWVVSISAVRSDDTTSDKGIDARVSASGGLFSRWTGGKKPRHPGWRYRIHNLYQSQGVGPQALGSSSTGLLDTARRTLIVTGLYAKGLLICRDTRL